MPILAITSTDDVEERIRLLEAGADDVMIRPIDERELDARVEALDLRHRRSKEMRPSDARRRDPPARPPPDRRLLAEGRRRDDHGQRQPRARHRRAHAGPVALVDLTPMGGHVATHLDLRPKLTVADLDARQRRATISPEILRARTSPATTAACSCSPAPPAPTTARSLMAAAETERILEAVLTAVPTVVVDLGSHLDERVVAGLEAADDVVIVVTPDFPALKSVHSFLEFLGEGATQRAEPTIVVNEVYALQTLTPGDIETALGRRVAIRIPYDPLLYLRAANQGTPVFAGAPTSQPVAPLRPAGRGAPRRGRAGVDAGAAPARPRRDLRAKLGGRRRRCAGEPSSRVARGLARVRRPRPRRGSVLVEAPRSARR